MPWGRDVESGGGPLWGHVRPKILQWQPFLFSSANLALRKKWPFEVSCPQVWDALRSCLATWGFLQTNKPKKSFLCWCYNAARPSLDCGLGVHETCTRSEIVSTEFHPQQWKSKNSNILLALVFIKVVRKGLLLVHCRNSDDYIFICFWDSLALNRAGPLGLGPKVGLIFVLYLYDHFLCVLNTAIFMVTFQYEIKRTL